MTIRDALTRPAMKRLIALAAVYVLALQALFGAGGQLRLLVSDAPGLCTILGFQEPDAPRHAMDACTLHCAAQVAADGAGLATNAALVLTLIELTAPHAWRRRTVPAPALAFRGRAPPR